VLVALVIALPASADEMQDAMDRAEVLNLMLQVRVQPSQAQQMLGPLQRIQELVKRFEDTQTNALNQLATSLQRARAELIAGEELSAQTIAALDGYQQQREAGRQALYSAVAEQMQLIASALTAEQNRYLDWTPPGAIRPEELLAERVQMQQVAMGRVQEAARMLDAVKHLDAFNFVTARGPIVSDYLALYFRPDAQQFQQAYQIAVNYTSQVRMLDEQQWQAQSLDFGAGLVEELGLMPQMDPGVKPGTVPWGRLYRIVTNPQTLPVMRGLAQ